MHFEMPAVCSAGPRKLCKFLCGHRLSSESDGKSRGARSFEKCNNAESIVEGSPSLA